MAMTLRDAVRDKIKEQFKAKSTEKTYWKWINLYADQTIPSPLDRLAVSPAPQLRLACG